jgi:predicted dehydrogenase
MIGTREIRLGMIGCGQISKRFFDQAEQLEGVRFVATCAAHEDTARAKAQERGCERWFTDYHQLLADPDVDGVVITTPHQMHARMATESARARKHVLVEKPMATRWCEAQEMVQAAEEAGVTFLALPFVHYPEFLEAVRYAREEYIGKITGLEAQLSFAGPPRSNWYYSKEAEGGAMLDTLVYPLASVAALMGPASRIAAFANTLIPLRICGDGGQVRSEVDDNVTLILEYATGQQAVVRSCWAQSYMQRGVVLHGRHGAIFLNNTSPTVVVKSDLQQVPGATPIEFLGLPNCYAPTVPPRSVSRDIIWDFVECIRTGITPKSSARIGLHVVEQQQKAYESSRTGRILDLTTTFDVWWNREPAIMDLSGDYL